VRRTWTLHIHVNHKNIMDIIARILNPLLMIAMPLALGVFLAQRLKADWRLFGIGAVTFISSQVFHIPFNAWILSPAVDKLGLSITQQGIRLAAAALLFGLSAGVFEETARYLVYRFWLEEDREWESALMLGAGHGGVEAIILGAIVVYALIQALTLRGADLSAVVPADQIGTARAQIEAYWSAPWYAAILGAVERAATICFHLSASVLVARAFTRRNILWLGAAIGWHTLLDAVAVYAVRTWGPYMAEAFIVAAGLASVGIIFKLKTTRQAPGQQPPPPTLTSPQIQPAAPTPENLEDTRYV
ncbi:MAG: YhfC family glutamic-type intramembrane protease, partial [Chloroflexota bacterium]